MRFRLAVRLAIAATVLLAAGCSSGSPGSSPPGSAPSSGGSATIPLLRMGSPYAPANLDPASGSNAWELSPLILETLIKLGPQGQLEPDLATSVTNPKPVTYVYHLRHGVRFWDGSLMTSADVVYSWDYERAPGAAYTTFWFHSVKSIRAAGRYAVVVTLTHPDATWPYSPSSETTPVFEKKFALAHKGSFGKPGTLVMGTGPWEIDSLDPTKGAQLSANPHWWGGKVPIRRITYTYYSSETSLALAFRAGQVDFDPYITDERSFASASGARIITAPSQVDGVFSMNTHAPGWDDVHVRRAVAYALNRTDILAANGGRGTPIYTLIPAPLLRPIASQAQISSLLGSLPRYSHDIAKARQEMARSAYPHGFSATILEYAGTDQAVNIGQAIAAELQRIGIKAQVKAVTPQAWAAVETGPASKRLATFTFASTTTPDASGFNYLLGSQDTKAGLSNYADYAPAGIDRLLAASITTLNRARRLALFSQLLRRLGSDVPYVPLYSADNSAATSAGFTDPGYSQWFNDSPYTLDVRPAA
jgi:peptide/nickel transport system substrate-binding protein